MKKAFLVFTLLVVLGLVGYSLSFTEANVVSSAGLKITESEQALISISTSAFTATELEKVHAELASPTDMGAPPSGEAGSPAGDALAGETPVQEPRTIASDNGAPQNPVCAEIKGALIVTNNMSTPFAIEGLTFNESDIACLYPSEKYLLAGGSASFIITFMGDPTVERVLTGELLGSFEGGSVRVGFDLPVLADALILQAAAAAEDVPAQP